MLVKRGFSNHKKTAPKKPAGFFEAANGHEAPETLGTSEQLVQQLIGNGIGDILPPSGVLGQNLLLLLIEAVYIEGTSKNLRVRICLTPFRP